MASGTCQALLVGDDLDLSAQAATAARTARCELTTVADLAQAGGLVAKKQFDLILIRPRSADPDALRHFLDLDLANQGRIVLMDGAAARGDASGEAAKLAHVSESLSADALTQLMRQALEDTPSKEIPCDGAFSGMVGRTPRMQALFASIRRIAPLDVGVLVYGESGTGKELVARALHALSGRSGRFVAVNCGAVAPELLASQMFGHERGAFTGATQSHPGYFEQAQGGTLFLDEISEMRPELQVYLLRVLEARSLTRIGGTREIAVDVRIIAASNRDLQRAVAAGELRQDLYFRLLEFPLAVPPLRERREDIPSLARHFLGLLNARHEANKRISNQVLRELCLRSWPGNVRELRHAVQRLYILAGERDEIDAVMEPEPPLQRRVSDLQRHVDAASFGAGRGGEPLEGTEWVRFEVGMTLDDVERTVLLKTLAHCRNDKRKAAGMLGVSLKTVYNKLLRYRSEGLIGEDLLRESPEDSGRAA